MISFTSEPHGAGTTMTLDESPDGYGEVRMRRNAKVAPAAPPCNTNWLWAGRLMAVDFFRASFIRAAVVAVAVVKGSCWPPMTVTVTFLLGYVLHGCPHG